MHRIDVLDKATAADTDFLAGTALDPVPADGYMRIYVASTVNTLTIAINPSVHLSPTGPGVQAGILRANGEIRAYDPHWEIEVEKGERVVIALAGTTGTYYVWCSYVGVH